MECTRDKIIFADEESYNSNNDDDNDDAASFISDYSEMGYQIRKSIKFDEMIVSSYSDLKNPNKSVVRNGKGDANEIRKYNVLNLAMEFSKFNETNQLSNQLDSTLGDSLSDNIDAGFTEMSNGCPTVELPPQNELFKPDSLSSGVSSLSHEISPLNQHVNQKLHNCFNFSKRKTSVGNNYNSYIDQHNESFDSGSDSGATTAASLSDSEDKTRKKKSTMKSNFQQKYLSKMPEIIRDLDGSIHKFDMSNKRYLNMLNINQLQIMYNSIFNIIEELNESLVMNLIIRDEIKSEQQELILKVEELTISTQSLARELFPNYSMSDKQLITNANYNSCQSKSSSVVLKFFQSIVFTPKYATNKFLSIFSSHPLPQPEFV